MKNSMDFEPAKELMLYISFFYDKDTETAKSVWGNMVDKSAGTPVFEKIYIQNLNLPKDVPLVSPYKVKSAAKRDVISWGSLLLAITATTYSMF